MYQLITRVLIGVMIVVTAFITNGFTVSPCHFTNMINCSFSVIILLLLFRSGSVDKAYLQVFNVSFNPIIFFIKRPTFVGFTFDWCDSVLVVEAVEVAVG